MRRFSCAGASVAVLLCGLSLAVNAQQPPSRISADTRLATSCSASFTAPAGWSVRSTDAIVVLQTPVPYSHFVFIDVHATDATAAVSSAWKIYMGDAKLTLKLPTF